MPKLKEKDVESRRKKKTSKADEEAAASSKAVLSNMNSGDTVQLLARVRSESIEKRANNIRVAVRCRPPNKREISLPPEEGAVVVEMSSAESGEVFVQGRAEPFTFDVAFPFESTQLEVFDALGVDLVQAASHGFNATLFAYGQTSSGKTCVCSPTPSPLIVVSFLFLHTF